MTKLYPKILTLALSISILLSIFLLPTTKVVAEDQTYETKTILATDEAKYIDNDVRTFLENSGININSNDLISLVSYKSNARSIPTTEIEITSWQDNLCKTTFLQAYALDENGDTQLTNVPIEAVSNGASRSSKRLTFKELENSYNLTLVFNAYYNVYYNPTGTLTVFLSPIGFDFVYKYTNGTNSSNCNFAAITISCQTEGALYYGFDECRNDEYVHYITDSFVPTVNVTHTKTDPLLDNYYIVPNDGESGVYFVFRVYINGKNLQYSRRPDVY